MKAVCGDIENNEVRKQIVRNFIREIILYKDKIVITYNFTDKHFTKKQVPDNINDIEKEIKQAEKPVLSKDSCVYKNSSTPP